MNTGSQSATASVRRGPWTHDQIAAIDRVVDGGLDQVDIALQLSRSIAVGRTQIVTRGGHANAQTRAPPTRCQDANVAGKPAR